MARSFSQEPRSDSHKIGETRYRMSHLPSTTAIARTLLLAGILLAVTVLAARSFFPVFAQDAADDTLVIRNFSENSMDAVATYSALDPEGEMVDWEVIRNDPANSPDEDDFDVSDQGELTFKNAPDFEAPTSSVTIGELEDRNRYRVRVVASDPDDNTYTIDVTVYVRNVEETGTVVYGTIQPRQGIDLTATLTDDDVITAATTTWKWERSLDGSTDWTEATTTTENLAAAGDTETSTYAPVKADVNHYLRVTVSYTDQEGPRKMSEPKVTDNKVGSSLVNSAPYFVYSAVGEIPEGADEEVEDKIPDDTSLTREIAENSDEDEDVGDPVKAADDNGDNLTYAFDMDSDITNNEVATGVDNAVTVTVNNATFDIDRSTGQITVGANTELNYEVTRSYDVVVTATDPSGDYDSIVVRISVTNVQEKPTIASGLEDITQYEITYNPPGSTTRNPATTTRDGAAEPSEYTNSDTAIVLADYTAADHEDSNATLLKWSLSGSHADVVVICDANESNQEECGTEGITSSNATVSTVELRLIELPDYEDPANKNNHFVVELTVTDRTRPTALTDTIDVTIEVINIDEPGTVVLSHPQPEVNADITASLTDPDGKSNVKWRWYADGEEITGNRGDDATFRPLNSTDSTPPRVELGKRLEAVASYTDGHGSGKKATSTPPSFTVQAEDVDNDVPVFKEGGATTTRIELTFMEDDTPENLGVADAVAVEDDDPNAELIYTLDDTHDYKLFTIPFENRDDREIYLAEGTKFDYESKEKYELDLVVTDTSGESATLVVIVNIEDVQEAPRVAEGQAEFYYPENKNGNPNTDSVHTFKATDDDDKEIGGGRKLTWRLSTDTTDNTHVAFFNVTEEGELSFKSSPDFETTDQNAPGDDRYLVKLEVFDNGDENGSGVLSKEVPVTVEVTNVDEPGTVTFDTLQPLEKMAFTAELSDDDGITETATTTWKWERSDNGTSNWTLATTTVESPPNGNDVTVTMYTPVADDVGKFLQVTVSYRDAEDPDPLNPAKMSEPMVTANSVARNLVNDEPFFVYTEDEEIPEGEKLGGKIPKETETVVRKIAENSAEDTTIGEAIKADDEDRDINNNKDVLTYAFDTNDTPDQKADAVTVTVSGAKFDIDRSTGQISLGSDTELNHEATPNTYDVTVTATDPSGYFDEIDVRIEVTNVEENPEIEGAAEVGLTEVIDSPPAATTTIDETVTARNAFNMGTDDSPRYELRVATYMATDHEDDAQDPRVAAALNWTLSGTDRDRFILYGDVDGENAPNTDDIDEFGVEDVVSADTNTSTVVLFLKELPDYENPANSSNTYSVTLTVTDTTHPKGLTDTLDVTIRVTNVEETGTVKMSNRQPEVGVPVSSALTDSDEGLSITSWRWATAQVTGVGEGTRIIEEDHLPAASWETIAGATSDTYSPVSGDAGKLLAATAIYGDDANEDNPFTHDVDESELSATGTAVFAVRGPDSNNQAPVFPDQDPNTQGDQSDRATRSIPEDAVYPAVVEGPVSANVDRDGEGDQREPDNLTYTLGGPDAGLFSIDQDNPDATPSIDGGQIRVAKGTKFDFETKSTYTVTVTATDPSRASDTITVTIAIQDVNEAPAVEMVEQLRLTGDTGPSIAENQTGTVTTFRATGPGSDTATWSVTGTGRDAGSFSISGGVLSVPSALNFESPSDANRDNAYELTVTAQAGNMSRSLDVRVTVTNVDEGGSVNLSSPGNEVKVGVQLTAQLDEGDEEVVTGWQWSSGGSNTGPWTNISVATSNTYTPVDGDVGDYLRITVSYTDATFGPDSLSAVTASAVEAASTAGTPGTLALSPTTQLTSGDTVTATLTDADNPVASSYVWRWERSADGSTNWSTISAATSASYTTTDDDAGNYLRATVTYTDDSGAGQTAGPVATTDRVKLHTYDADADGRINRSEVIEAIRDFLVEHSISRPEVIEVIRLYLTRR